MPGADDQAHGRLRGGPGTAEGAPQRGVPAVRVLIPVAAGALAVVRRHRPLAVVTLVLAVVAAAEVVLPGIASNAVFGLTSLAGVVSVAIGPLVRRTAMSGPFRWLLASGTTLTIAIAVAMVDPTAQITDLWASADVWALTGYGLLLVFLASLLRHARGNLDRFILCDVGVIATGAAAVLWSTEVAPALGRPGERLIAVVIAAYMLLDVVMLALTVLLALQAYHRGPALWALLSGMTALMIGDVASVAVGHGDTLRYHLVRVGYMIAVALLGIAATHPSSGQLAEPGALSLRQEVTALRRAALSAAILLPGTVALLVRGAGRTDQGVRAGLVAVVMALVAFRLLHTVTALGRQQRHSAFLVSHDPLTGLASRTALLDDLEGLSDRWRRVASRPEPRSPLVLAVHTRLEAVARGYAVPEHGVDGVTSGQVALLVLDTAGITLINDTWGHAAGDAVMRQLAVRLAEIVAGRGQVYRIGGNDFAVLSLCGPHEVHGLAEEIVAGGAQGLRSDAGQPLAVTMTAGTATAPLESAQVRDLLRDADTAMHHAQEPTSVPVVEFDTSLRTRICERQELAEDLRHAAADGQIVAFYQPICGGPDFGVLTGFEALARWHHPERGMVPPVTFIPLAEDTGGIVEIGELILRQACNRLVAWRARTGADLHVSVNVSQAQIFRSDVPALVARVLDETGLPAHALWLEITESLVAQDAGVAREAMTRLKQLGVVLALDDFGTGYSSLSCVRDFPVDVVKIDRSFVQRLGDDRTQALARTIVEMVGALDLTGVVAEGVETPEQAQILAGMGCQWVQGWLYGKPGAAEDTLLTDPGVRFPVPASPARSATA